MTVHVVVAVLTYRRPVDLAAGLPLVLDQVHELNAGSGGAYDARVVIVDNDPGQSARETITALSSTLVQYVAEPEPGIAAARNRALDVAAAGAHVIVFIDDDERPRARWLRSLLETWERHRSAAVAGRVVPLFTSDVTPWITAGRFFVRRSLPTGTPVVTAAAGNLLLDIAQLARLGLRFDDRLGLRGGEDTLLTRQIVASGGTIVWCDESVVEDCVPADRATRRWVLQRAWSHGNTATLVDLALDGGARYRAATRARAAATGAARIAVGAARGAFGTIVRSDHHSARGLRTLFRGAGMVAAALGVTHHEYARPDVTDGGL